MTLREKQTRFAKLVPRLIDKAFELGYEVTLGDAYRDPRVHGIFGQKVGYSRARSCHKLRLAIDLNLFKNGKYIIGSEGHTELGKWWLQQDPDARHGGAFADWNHYSFEHDGSQ